MDYLSVCSGIEAISVAWHDFARPVGFAEIAGFPASVLGQRFPTVPNYGDLTTLAARVRSGEIPAPSVLVGGTPCQAFSFAGMRLSLDDARGRLTFAYVDLANAIDAARLIRGEPPAVIVWENVAGCLRTHDNAFGGFLAALAGESAPFSAPGKRWPRAGLVIGPQRVIAWRTLDAQYFGVAQRRRRVFVVASARKGFDPASVLFESEGRKGNSPPQRNKVEKAAACTAARFAGSSRPGMTGGVVCLAHGQAGAEIGVELAPTLTCLHEAPIVAFPEEVAGALCAVDGVNGLGQQYASEGKLIPVAFVMTDGHAGTFDERDVANTLTANGDRTRAAPIVVDRPVKWRVRRLTPRECERLQGFPDDWTNIPWRGKTTAPDGPRYTSLGNSMAVPVVRWIGQRIVKAMA